MVADRFKELGLKRLDSPPYSPDLAPSDFFLFGYLKRKIEGYELNDENQLFEKVSETLYSIPNQLFVAAYEEWIIRLETDMNSDGSYFT